MQVLARNEAALLERRREEVAEEVKLLKSKVAYLQGLYQEQDELLAGLFGETYGSEEEKHIEVQLDKVRSYRDTLAGGLLEWQEAATLVQSATELLDRAVTCWKEIDSQSVTSPWCKQNCYKILTVRQQNVGVNGKEIQRDNYKSRQ